MCSDQSVPRRCIIVPTMHRTLLYCTRLCVQLLSVAVRVLSLSSVLVTEQCFKIKNLACGGAPGEESNGTLKRCLSAAGEIHSVDSHNTQYTSTLRRGSRSSVESASFSLVKSTHDPDGLPSPCKPCLYLRGGRSNGQRLVHLR